MKSYELTERGKIIIAVILVILLLVPSTILAIKAYAGTAPPADDPPVTAVPLPATPSDDLPENSEPLPNGSGSNPLEPEDDPADEPTDDEADDPTDNPAGEPTYDEADDPTDDPADEPTDDEADDPAGEPVEQDPPQGDDGEAGSYSPPGEQQEFGPVSLDISKGTMVFIFSPALQNTLDPETTAMLGEFITSPENKTDSRVLVEMPGLSQEDTTTVVSAVTMAFALHDVARKDLVFITLQTKANEGPFEVMLSFYDPPRDGPPSPK